jgi:pyruvate dehydrogenase E2 component (dihydrolipoamide acetyltransferase)/2-oxoisovalerate dehydrogenase E2 component (dihydrolipoyl transacylase)
VREAIDMDFRVPELGEGVYEAELVSWLVQPGAAVKRGQNLMEVLTDKATMEVPSPFAGTITELRAQPGQTIKVGDVVLAYRPAGESAEESASEVAPATVIPDRSSVPSQGNGPAFAANEKGLPVKAAPAVRYMARKLGIDLTRLRGTGPGGRILIEDLKGKVPATTESAPERPAEPRPDYGRPGSRIKLQGIRRKIAEHMVQSKRTIPHYSYIDECEVSELVKLREAVREPYARSGVKITYLAFFIKAVVAALKEVPLVNSSLDEAAGEIVLHDRYHIGIAVSAPSGLIVPVVHDADRKDLTEIAREVERLSTDARSGKVRREDLSGGTFTITSIGNIGGLISTPIINSPEVGILGIGKVVKRPMYDAAGNLRPADLVYLSFSFDHRVLDGAIGAAFGNAVIRRLQNPAALLLPEKLTS